MSKRRSTNSDSLNFIAPLLLITYQCIGFIPNWQAVDKIAPQWLFMSILNLVSLFYFFRIRKSIAEILTLNLKSKLTLTYVGFILWAMASLFYAINPTEVFINLARQINVFLMFFSMATLSYRLKNKINLLLKLSFLHKNKLDKKDKNKINSKNSCFKKNVFVK